MPGTGGTPDAEGDTLFRMSSSISSNVLDDPAGVGELAPGGV